MQVESSERASSRGAFAREPSTPTHHDAAPHDEPRATAEHREHLLLADAARYVAEQGERRYRALVETSTSLVWTADANGLVVSMPRWHELTGLSADAALGDGWIGAVHDDDQQRVRDAFAAARVLGRPADCELRLRAPDGTYRWLEVRAAPVRGDHGEIVEWIGTCTDVHERKRTEETLSLLADASRVLLASLDVQATIDGLAALLVPRVADICHIDLVDETTGELRRAAVQLADPAKLALFHEMTVRYPPSASPLYASATTVRTGQARLLNDLDDLYYLSLASDQEHLRYIRAIAPRSYIATPLVAGGATLGCMVVSHSESGRRFGEADVAVFEELARRAAQAVHNARLLAAERRTRSAAETSARTRGDFLANVSHELRTPLNAIIGYASLMTDEIVGPVNDAQRAHLGRMTARARHLVEIADHVLTLARLESGEARPAVTDVDVAAVCREAVSLLEPAAREKGLHVDVAISGDVGLRRADEACLRQILVSLLSNAVKFTDHGTVSLVVRTDREWLRLIVRDTGHGIAPEHLERVFDRFWQREPAHARPFTGGGLGLSVARDLARLLGGDIDVESVPGQGSTFTVRLPA